VEKEILPGRFEMLGIPCFMRGGALSKLRSATNLRVSHISLVFREIWDTTAFDVLYFGAQQGQVDFGYREDVDAERNATGSRNARERLSHRRYNRFACWQAATPK
jgi:hypothetical protein